MPGYLGVHVGLSSHALGIDALSAGFRLYSRPRWLGGLCDDGRDEHGEGRPLPDFTFDCDVPAHHLAEALRDRETQPCSPELPCGRGIRLDERLKQVLKVFRRNADPGIAYRKGDPSRRNSVIARDCQGYRAMLSELARIAQQIEERLAQLHHVGQDRPGAVRTVDDEPVFVRRGERLGDRDDLTDQVGDADGLDKEFDLPRLDLRVVEDEVDHGDQVLACQRDLFQIRQDLRITQFLRILLKDLGVPDNGPEACATHGSYWRGSSIWFGSSLRPDRARRSAFLRNVYVR